MKSDKKHPKTKFIPNEKTSKEVRKNGRRMNWNNELKELKMNYEE